MNESATMMPSVVHTIWWIGLGSTLLVFVPIAVYMLHRAWGAARSIEIYAREALVAAQGIAGNTANVKALDATIATAGGMLESAGEVAKKLDTIANVLAQRAR